MRTKELDHLLHDWFARFGECVAALDDAGAAALVASDVVSFGTRMNIVAGLDALMADQWQHVWPSIQDFRFDLDSLHAGGGENTAWGVCLWTSTGFDDGEPFPRPGRATVILERREGRWLAVHTHFSLFPRPDAGS